MKSIAFALTLIASVASALPGLDSLEARGAPISCLTCNPLPEFNKCHSTTSCIYIWGHQGSTPGPNYCACRAGYKADPRKVGADPSAQWRLPWPSQEGRVFVRPGVECDTLCDQWQLGKDGCKEVTELASCL